MRIPLYDPQPIIVHLLFIDECWSDKRVVVSYYREIRKRETNKAAEVAAAAEAAAAVVVVNTSLLNSVNFPKNCKFNKMIKGRKVLRIRDCFFSPSVNTSQS